MIKSLSIYLAITLIFWTGWFLGGCHVIEHYKKDAIKCGVGLIGLILGLLAGLTITSGSWERETISRGFATYNQTNRAFQWNTNR